DSIIATTEVPPDVLRIHTASIRPVVCIHVGQNRQGEVVGALGRLTSMSGSAPAQVAVPPALAGDLLRRPRIERLELVLRWRVGSTGRSVRMSGRSCSPRAVAVALWQTPSLVLELLSSS